MYKRANAGHVGSSLSCAEILVFLRLGWMRERDSLILSKGHAAGALYSLLAEVGRLSPAQIDSFYQDGTHLAALPPVDAIEDIPFATGSLGYGLSLSAGLALAARFDGSDRRIFCVTSDGELNEGSVWEAALFVRHHHLDNVVWVVDRNGIQAIGRTEEVLGLEPLDEKLRAFGFHVVIADGHDFQSLRSARQECARAIAEGNGPVVIIAKTTKGHGISSFQDTVDCHYLPLTDAQHERALEEVTRAHEPLARGHRDAE
jgi:transketolase